MRCRTQRLMPIFRRVPPTRDQNNACARCRRYPRHVHGASVGVLKSHPRLPLDTRGIRCIRVAQSVKREGRICTCIAPPLTPLGQGSPLGQSRRPPSRGNQSMRGKTNFRKDRGRGSCRRGGGLMEPAANRFIAKERNLLPPGGLPGGTPSDRFMYVWGAVLQGDAPLWPGFSVSGLTSPRITRWGEGAPGWRCSQRCAPAAGARAGAAGRVTGTGWGHIWGHLAEPKNVEQALARYYWLFVSPFLTAVFYLVFSDIRPFRRQRPCRARVGVAEPVAY